MLVENSTVPTGSLCRLSHKVKMKFSRLSSHLKDEQKYRLLHLFCPHGNPVRRGLGSSLLADRLAGSTSGL